MRTSRGRALHRAMYLRNELPGSLARSLLIMTGLLTAGVTFEQGRDPRDQAALQMTRQEVIEQFMRPYTGPRIRGVDTSTLYGKALCGYQGWFTAPGDGSGRGFTHYEDVYVHDFEPGHANIDFWPDVSELGADEKFATPFRHRDGRIAYVYSAQHPKTVMRHFKWMKEYGIDGALLQRFATVIDNPIGLRQMTVVLNNCRAGANANGRAYAVEYTVDRGPQGQMQTIIEDWKLLIDRMKITSDPAYLHHNGRPVVAFYGLGLKIEEAPYTLDDWERLLRFFREDPRYGGCTIILGIPAYWRELKNDCIADARVDRLLELADVLSPWNVGRYQSPAAAERWAETMVKPDLEWCKAHGKELMPVVFPGSSWFNLTRPWKQHSPFDDVLDPISRRKGAFLRAQYVAFVRAGVKMVFQAMFDEMDEGTQIMKCTNDPPIGPSPFATYEGLPSDHYLKLVGQATRLVRGEIKTLPPATQHALDGASWRAVGPTRGEDGLFFLNIDNGRALFRMEGDGQALAAKPGNSFLYFAVEGGPPKTKVKSILAQVEFLDNHTGQPLVLEYDSRLADGDTPGYRRAVLRGGGERTGSGRWKKANFLLDQPVFAGRPPNSGADFRLQGEDLVIRSVKLTEARSP